MVHPATYRISFTGLLSLVLLSFLISMAAPYIQSDMGEAYAAVDFIDPFSTAPEEEGHENPDDLDQDLKLRAEKITAEVLVSETRIGYTSAKLSCDHEFLEIPNPPPEFLPTA